MKNKILFLFLIFLLSSIAFADDSDDAAASLNEMSQNYQDVFTGKVADLEAYLDEDACGVEPGFSFNFFSPSILIAFALVLISTLAYMVGQFLQSPQILQFAKEEFYQTGITIFLAMIVLISIVSVDEFGNFGLAFFDYEAASVIDQAMKVSYVMINKVSTDIAAMTMFNGILTFFASSTITLGSFHSSISISPGLALKPLTDIVTLSAQTLSVALSEWIFHLFSLCFIKKWAISFFLPFGMILRAIPQTRDGGSGMIALMLVLYMVYPVMFLAMGNIYHAVHKDLDLQGIAINLVSEFALGAGVLTMMLAFISRSFLTPIIMFAGVDTIMVFLCETVFIFFIMSLILPFFSIMFTLTAVREISKNFFGADINLSSIIRIL